MSEIPLRPTDDLDEQGDPIHLRVMTADEIREREAENIANTAPRLRARVLAETSMKGAKAALAR